MSLVHLSEDTYHLLAVPVKGGFHKQGPKGKAQRVIRVGDAGLPARGAGLEAERKKENEAWWRAGD